MEIEELFCKRYPEYSVNGKPLHPYFDVFEEGYEQAEKENEELKAEIENDRDLPTVAYMQGAENQKKKDEKQLTKARELLNEFMRISKASDEVFEHDYSELIGATEQFLQEIEK